MVTLADAFLLECPATPISHIKGGIKGLAANRLFEVTIYVTRACNLSCRHCYISAGKPLEDELGSDEWGMVFRQLGDLGVEILYILGGEPMMRRDIYEIISLARRNMPGSKISMSTNGTLISREAAVKLRDSGLDEVQVSIDGPTARVNDPIRTPGSFMRAIMAVRHLKEAGLRVTLAYVVMDENADYVEDMVRLAESLGVDGINFSPVVGFGRALVNGISLSRDNAMRVLETLMNIRSKVPITINGFRFYLSNIWEAYREALVSLGDYARYYRTCPAGTSRLVIDSNGDVYGCELLIPAMKEGNVRERSIRDIWLSGFRSLRLRGIEGISPCSKCSMANLCQGGCAARALARFGTVNAPDPLCPLVGYGKGEAMRPGDHHVS